MPIGGRSRLVDIQAQVSDRLRVSHGLFEIQIRRRVVDRIGIQNYQPVDLARIQVIDQLLHLVDLRPSAWG